MHCFLQAGNNYFGAMIVARQLSSGEGNNSRDDPEMPQLNSFQWHAKIYGARLIHTGVRPTPKSSQFSTGPRQVKWIIHPIWINSFENIEKIPIYWKRFNFDRWNLCCRFDSSLSLGISLLSAQNGRQTFNLNIPLRNKHFTVGTKHFTQTFHPYKRFTDNYNFTLWKVRHKCSMFTKFASALLVTKLQQELVISKVQQSRSALKHHARSGKKHLGQRSCSHIMLANY